MGEKGRIKGRGVEKLCIPAQVSNRDVDVQLASEVVPRIQQLERAFEHVRCWIFHDRLRLEKLAREGYVL